jgi:hypothetical protein
MEGRTDGLLDGLSSVNLGFQICVLGPRYPDPHQ